MSLLSYYQQHIKEKNFCQDPAQIAVIEEMQRIADALQTWDKPVATTEPVGTLERLFSKKSTTTTPTWVKGLYCYGGVGRGKTVLMDLFMQYLPTKRKRRRHFHRFMLEMHDALNQTKNVENPIDLIIKKLAQRIDIICLDEFFVADIADAMLFDRIFHAMKQHGITLVTTSNIEPKNLYKDGLQRQRFLPAIAWIEANLVVHHIADGEDFRHRHFSQQNVFRSPDSSQVRQAIEQDLINITGNTPRENSALSRFRAGSREIPLIFRLDHGIMFDFNVLCVGNYSQKDYIEIGKRFPYVALVGIPLLDNYYEDAAKRFLLLIDEFYDRGVKLLISSDVAIEEIYQGKKLRFEYERVQSRLFEMQGKDYWNSPHLA